MLPQEPEPQQWRPGPGYPSERGNRQEAQLALIRDRFPNVVEPGPLNWQETGVKYLVRRGFLMVAEEYHDEVRAYLTERGMARPLGDVPEPAYDDEREDRPKPVDPWGREEARHPELPETDLGAPPRDGARAHGVRWIALTGGTLTLEALRVIEEESGLVDVEEEMVAPEYFVHLANTGGNCPADEPYPIEPGTPPDPAVTCDRFAGTGVRVVVLDTGLDPSTARFPWMRGVTGDTESGLGGNLIPPYGGHGSFIAGLIRAMAPRAEVLVRAAFRAGGLVSELDLVSAMRRTLRDDHPDVINLSAGTTTRRATGPMLLNRFYDRVFRRYKGVALVAAAGNDGWRTPFWPAAATWTVSVGALADDWRSRAWFSNHGGWVDVYAPGTRLINVFPTGNYRYAEPPYTGQVVPFAGMARWSGTSFSTPLVAGMIAARMSHTGENGVDAARALIHRARRSALPGVGAALLPADDCDCAGRGPGADPHACGATPVPPRACAAC